MACAGAAALVLLTPFLLEQRKVTLDPNLRVLQYQARGLHNVTFMIPLDVVTESDVVTEAFLSGGEGSGLNQVPLDSIKTLRSRFTGILWCAAYSPEPRRSRSQPAVERMLTALSTDWRSLLTADNWVDRSGGLRRT